MTKGEFLVQYMLNRAINSRPSCVEVHFDEACKAAELLENKYTNIFESQLWS